MESDEETESYDQTVLQPATNSGIVISVSLQF